MVYFCPLERWTRFFFGLLVFYYQDEKMKKLLVLAGITILLFLGSCATSKEATVKIVFDDSVPIEKTSWISFGLNLGTVTGYNGISVSGWKTEHWDMIQIPAGDTVIELDIDHTSSIGNYHTRYRANNMMFRYNFQPQKQYWITWEIVAEGEGWFAPVKYGVSIYSWDFGEKISYGWLEDDDPHNLGFVPFLIQPVFRNR
jgi:hypothetical protein